MTKKTKAQQKFVDTVWGFYHEHGRTALPWRKTTNPYRIVVSEIMLQQTQVDRVIPKYKAFLKQFPTTKALASAPLGEVLVAWQGLGYNRRAKMLHQCAQVVTDRWEGRWPREYKDLLSLPGVGSYTAGAVRAFAYNQPMPILETNIRTVYIHHFFADQVEVSESDIAVLVAVTLDIANPREWYWALMDYGSHLKKTVGNLNTRTKAYAKQSTFKGSDRQIRGAIIRTLSNGAIARRRLMETLSEHEGSRVALQLKKLCAEELVVKEKGVFRLP